MKHGIDIIVVNYKTPEDLENFLFSLNANQPQGSFSVTVCNPEEGPGDKEVAEKWKPQFEKYTHVGWDMNTGYARSVNAGAKSGNHSVIAIFNADCVITQPDFFDKCAAAFDLHPSWGILGPQQVDHRGLMTHAGIFGEPTAPAHRGWHQPHIPQFDDVREAVTVSGAAFFITRECWNVLTHCPIYQKSAPEAEGAFLPTTHYYEETYCTYHAKAHDYKVVYYGHASLIHKWHQASPVGGWAEQQFPISQRLFRAACDAHNIAHD